MTDLTRFNEYNLSEKPAINLLERMGYRYVPGANLAGERASLRDSILLNQLEAAIRQINPHLNESNIAQAIRRVTRSDAASLMEANESFHSDLVNYFSLPQDVNGTRQSLTVKLVDFDNPFNNIFTVANQYDVLGDIDRIIPDLVVFVNGLPLAVIECKSPTINHPLENGINQLQRSSPFV